VPQCPIAGDATGLCTDPFASAVLFNAVSCRVHLHGFGRNNLRTHPDWYIAMAVNGITYVNASNDVPPDDEGFFTYILDPDTCTASDFQHFNTYNNWGAHSRLISYLQALTDGGPRVVDTVMDRTTIMVIFCDQ